MRANWMGPLRTNSHYVGGITGFYIGTNITPRIQRYPYVEMLCHYDRRCRIMSSI